MFSSKSPQFTFPLWQYLNQPLFSPSIKLRLNPKEFWQTYSIEHLHRCLQQECAQKGNSHS
ncbi:MAG: hypothetical protein KME35_18890 [Aphanocapsa sp. GSE-SYN-MK-11-07L]|nr:hypothetical protein [Aphanocapsa sp. GSE-SYN-MK-11-07L]